MRTLVLGLPERAYPIHVGGDVLAQLGSLLKTQNSFINRHLLVVSQKQILEYHQKSIANSLERAGFSFTFFTPPHTKSSEAAKTQKVWIGLIDAISALDGKNRSLALVALGGGVVGDLTGFAAGVYRRGIPYVQVPTTLTAQVDSSIGGKTGIDLPQGKNLLGVIYQPSMVCCDLSLLSSLPERHWSDGFAEVIKYGVIKDTRLFTMLEKETVDSIKQNPKLLQEVVIRCARIKAEIVEKDELDKKGLRIVLNFGHTAGHAIEAVSGYSGRYTHGEAVGIGMLVACDIAAKMGILKSRELPARLEKMLIRFRLPVRYKGLSEDDILTAIGYDKKSEQKTNRFVLPIELGKTTLQPDVPAQVIREALRSRKG